METSNPRYMVVMSSSFKLSLGEMTLEDAASELRKARADDQGAQLWRITDEFGGQLVSENELPPP